MTGRAASTGDAQRATRPGRARRWAANVILTVVGVILWFAATRGWDEYGLWIAPTTAVLLAIAQLIFWVAVARRRDDG